jgi:hypothetical protein
MNDAAAALMCSPTAPQLTDAEMVELALNKRKHRITTQVVEAARGNEQYHRGIEFATKQKR